jgi:hypothetical protein
MGRDRNDPVPVEFQGFLLSCHSLCGINLYGVRGSDRTRFLIAFRGSIHQGLFPCVVYAYQWSVRYTTGFNYKCIGGLTYGKLYHAAHHVLNEASVMPNATAAKEPAIPVFPVDGKYLFKHYFEERDLYSRLSQFYNGEKYRFEIPESELEAVISFLRDSGKSIDVVEDVDEYVVVKKKYTHHPDLLFKESVTQRSQSGHNLFLMKNHSAVTAAITNGAAPITRKEFTFKKE